MSVQEHRQGAEKATVEMVNAITIIALVTNEKTALEVLAEAHRKATGKVQRAIIAAARQIVIDIHKR